MTIKASAALIFLATLVMGFAGALPATAADGENAVASKSESASAGKSVRHGSRSLKKRYAHRKSISAAAKSDESKKTDEMQVADASGSASAAIPPRIANANAQMQVLTQIGCLGDARRHDVVGRLSSGGMQP